MLSGRVALIFIFFLTICSSQGYRLSVKDVIPPEMVDEVIASAERPTGGSFAYSRPYPYGQFGMPYGQFGMPYGYNIRPNPGFGQMGQGEPIISGEETGEQMISEEEPIMEEAQESIVEEPQEPVIEEPINAEESEPVIEETGEEPIIEKRAIEDVVPIIIEIPVEDIIGEEPYEEEELIPEDVDRSVINEPVFEKEEPIVAEEPDEEVISEDPDGESVIIESPTEEEVENEGNYPE